MAAATASVDVPLTWRSVQIQTDQFGGAKLQAAIDKSGALKRLELRIRGRKLSIPQRCLQGLFRPYLNGIRIMYGKFRSGTSYWTVEIPFDGTGSVELGANFNLVFTERELVWSYQSVQIDAGTWEDRDVCDLPPGGAP